MLYTMLVIVITSVSLLVWCITVFANSHSFQGMNEPIHPMRYLLSIIIPIYMSLRGLRKGSLDQGGAIAGFILGVVMVLSSYSFMICVMVFYLSSSKLTKFKMKRKKLIDADYTEGGQRNWVQVLCNGGVPCELAILYVVDNGCREMLININQNYGTSFIILAFVSAVACSCGDTWASEIGMAIGTDQPRLITSWRKVPVGTNGGVSWVGAASSALGGALIGIAYFVSVYMFCDIGPLDPAQWPVIIYGAVSGLVGSSIDSVLGATLQYSGWCSRKQCVVSQASPTTTHITGTPLLDNNSVNLLSSLFTSLIMPVVAVAYWPLSDVLKMAL